MQISRLIMLSCYPMHYCTQQWTRVGSDVWLSEAADWETRSCGSRGGGAAGQRCSQAEEAAAGDGTGDSKNKAATEEQFYSGGLVWYVGIWFMWFIFNFFMSNKIQTLQSTIKQIFNRSSGNGSAMNSPFDLSHLFREKFEDAILIILWHCDLNQQRQLPDWSMKY